MLKFLSKVRIEFNPLDPKAASALEFMAQCNSVKAKDSNPNCQISVKRRTDDHHPQVAITFSNGHEELIDGSNVHAQDIRNFILDKSQMLETEQMFKDNEQPWPVIIPEEELKSTAKLPKQQQLCDG